MKRTQDDLSLQDSLALDSGRKAGFKYLLDIKTVPVCFCLQPQPVSVENVQNTQTSRLEPELGADPKVDGGGLL